LLRFEINSSLQPIGVGRAQCDGAIEQRASEARLAFAATYRSRIQ